MSKSEIKNISIPWTLLLNGTIITGSRSKLVLELIYFSDKMIPQNLVAGDYLMTFYTVKDYKKNLDVD